MENKRITGEMTNTQIVFAMSSGSLNGMVVCVDLLENGQRIDPDASHDGRASILMLDALGIYDERIWIFFYVCGQHLGKMIAVLRAHELGLAGVNTSVINHAVDSGRGLNLKVVMRAVKQRIPNLRLDVATA